MSATLLEFLMITAIAGAGTASLWKIGSFLWDRFVPKKPSAYEEAHRPGPTFRVIEGERKD